MSLTVSKQGRIRDQRGTAALEAFACLQATMGSKLHSALSAGRKWSGDLQTTFYQQFDVNSAQLAHVYRQVKAKRDAATEGAKANAKFMVAKAEAKAKQVRVKEKRLKAARKVIEEAPDKLRRLDRRIGKAKPDKRQGLLDQADALQVKVAGAAAERDRLRTEVHHHKRRLATLGHKRDKAERRSKTPRLCFGGRALFNAQHHLKANGYADHAAWKADWDRSRNGQVYVEGDGGYFCGNRFVRVTVAPDGSLDVEVVLPAALEAQADRWWRADNGKPMRSATLTGVRFGRGHAAVCAALLAGGQAITWRFVRDRKSWRAFVTMTELTPVAPAWTSLRGVIGLDLNEDHVALTHADRNGNPLRTWRFPLVTFRMSAAQRLDAIRKCVKAVAGLIAALDVPLVAERLDFSDKIAQLGSGEGAKRARMLSAFAYSSFADALDRACARAGVRLRRVDPSYTSLIGDAKFARLRGLSVHHAAALAIARRAMHLSETPPDAVEVSLGTRGRVALDPPVRMDRRHPWSWWRQVAIRKKRAREALPPPGGAQAPPDPRRRGTGHRPGRPAPGGPEGHPGASPGPCARAMVPRGTGEGA